MKGHSGSCRTVARFESTWLERVAAQAEAEHAAAFEPHGATYRVLPVRISHFTSVGEGVSLELHSDDPGKWTWWGDFESDLEVLRRPRFRTIWEELMDRQTVSAWIEDESAAYLAKLQSAD